MKYIFTLSIAVLLSSCAKVRPIMWQTENGWEPMKPGVYIILAPPKS